MTQMLQLWRSRERIKSSRANRTSKGAEKWLDVQEHQHGTAACISYLKVCLAKANHSAGLHTAHSIGLSYCCLVCQCYCALQQCIQKKQCRNRISKQILLLK